MEHQSLEALLAVALPKDCQLITHHVSTTPTECPSIFAAPPREKAEETRCESHLLSVSIKRDDQEIQVFAIEVLIYLTARLTTLFVSKADSTGYLHLLDLPARSPSVLRIVAQTFLQYLVRQCRRPNRRLVVSLFARAQNQYLFPGSVENAKKHVLDDRGLIKWWCRTLDPIIETEQRVQVVSDNVQASRESQAIGFLRVPGYDLWETRALVPKDKQKCTAINDRWKVADPLVELAGSKDLPERCIIPRFPDDPKARFLDTLDEELPDEEHPASQSLSQETLNRVNNGRWRSIRSLEQFWEAMSFRQECSSGRLVGFIWAVFTPVSLDSQGNGLVPISRDGEKIQAQSQEQTATQEDIKASEPIEVGAHTGTESDPVHSPDWPIQTAGHVVLDQSQYDEIGTLLLSLDYANIQVAATSTKTWSARVAKLAGQENWGSIVTGEHEVTLTGEAETNGKTATAVLSAGLIRKKKRPAETDVAAPAMNVAATLIRKKPKTNGDEELPVPPLEIKQKGDDENKG